MPHVWIFAWRKAIQKHASTHSPNGDGDGAAKDKFVRFVLDDVMSADG